MNEQEWLTSLDPNPVSKQLPQPLSMRKLLLYFVAYTNDVVHSLDNFALRRAHGLAAAVADSTADEAELREELRLAEAEDEPYGVNTPLRAIPGAIRYTFFAILGDSGQNGNPYIGGTTLHGLATQIAQLRYPSAHFSPSAIPLDPNWVGVYRGEQIAQTSLLREVFGNPFRPVTLDPAWLTSTVVALANGIYAERAFDRMPILSDALQDAGCNNDDVLNHCRGDGPHVRGCWLIDLLTGRE